MTDYVLIRSWHVVRLTRSLEPRTLCGRQGTVANMSPTLPAGKSCESCLRILARRQDADG